MYELDEVCEKCGKKKEMYYTPWCPFCDKPKVENHPVLNFIQAMRHLEVLGNIGIHDRMRDVLMYRDDYHNHSLIYLSFEDLEDEENNYEDYDPHYLSDLKLIKETFKINNDFVVFEISW